MVKIFFCKYSHIMYKHGTNFFSLSGCFIIAPVFTASLKFTSCWGRGFMMMQKSFLSRLFRLELWCFRKLWHFRLGLCFSGLNTKVFFCLLFLTMFFKAWWAETMDSDSKKSDSDSHSSARSDFNSHNSSETLSFSHLFLIYKKFRSWSSSIHMWTSTDKNQHISMRQWFWWRCFT